MVGKAFLSGKRSTMVIIKRYAKYELAGLLCHSLVGWCGMVGISVKPQLCVILYKYRKGSQLFFPSLSRKPEMRQAAADDRLFFLHILRRILYIKVCILSGIWCSGRRYLTWLGVVEVVLIFGVRSCAR